MVYKFRRRTYGMEKNLHNFGGASYFGKHSLIPDGYTSMELEECMIYEADNLRPSIGLRDSENCSAEVDVKTREVITFRLQNLNLCRSHVQLKYWKSDCSKPPRSMYSTAEISMIYSQHMTLE